MKKYLLIFTVLMAIALSMIPTYAKAGESVTSLSPKTSKIVGGVKSEPNAWPSTVALLDVAKSDQINNYQAQFCGATLVGSKWVLTAAHCVVDKDTGVVMNPSTIYALVGATNLINDGERITVKSIIVNPSYDHNTDDADLALLELDYAPFLDIPIMPISVNDAPTNLLATVVGWGELADESGDYPVDLYEVEIPIVSRVTCEAIYGADLTQNMICAGYSEGGKDTCKADSGGPLMGIQYGKYVQVGVTSWGAGCAQPQLYGVYTRLSNFENWIKAYTGEASYSSGDLSSWSRFYSGVSEGGSFAALIPLLLLLSGFIVLKRLKRKEG